MMIVSIIGLDLLKLDLLNSLNLTEVVINLVGDLMYFLIAVLATLFTIPTNSELLNMLNVK